MSHAINAAACHLCFVYGVLTAGAVVLLLIGLMILSSKSRGK